MTQDTMTANNSLTDSTQTSDTTAIVEYDPCANCGTRLNGQFCHDCGQSSRSMIKFFGSVVRELLDDALGYDSRAKHSLLPLMFKPGRLTLDYVKGRRFYYVMPFRLYLMASILLILLIKGVANTDELKFENIVEKSSQQEISEEISKEVNGILQEIGQADSEAKLSDPEAIQELKDKLSEAGISDSMAKQILAKTTEQNDQILTPDDTVKQVAELKEDENIEAVNELDKTADEQLRAEQDNVIPEEDNVMSEEEDPDLTIGVGGEDDIKLNWDNDRQQLSGVEEMEESWLKNFLEVINPKLKSWKDNPGPLIDELFEVLPYMMFIILPVFAVFLKLFYAFSRRYYTEHLIFLLLNHSFCYLLLMMIILLDLSEDLLKPIEHGLAQFGAIASGVTASLLNLWMFVYVFLAMKRFYRQGWFFTIVKTLSLGFIYMVMIVIGFIVSLGFGAYQA